MRKALVLASGLGCLVSLAVAAEQIGFAPGDAIDVPHSPREITRADLNDDAITDFILWSRADNRITLLTGNGDGTLTEGVTLTLPEAAMGLGVTDLNGDGVDDIVTGHAGLWVDQGLPAGQFAMSNGAHVFLSNDQGGWDGTSTTIRGRGPTAVLFLDLDGDDDLDVVLPNSDGVSYLLHDGNGGLGSPDMIHTDWRTRTTAIADLNGDDLPDLVGKIILWGNAQGGFTADLWQTEITPLGAVDLDDDGDVDLFGTAAWDHLDRDGSSALQIALNDGNGNFATPRSFSSVRGPFFGTMADDVNGDGLPELLTSNGAELVALHVNEGGGSFADPLTFAHHAQRGGPWSFTTANVDGDGRPDLVTVNLGGVYPASYVVHPQTLTVTPEITALTPATVLAGSNVSVSITGTGFTDTTTVDFGSGVVLTNLTRVSDTELTATLAIATYHPTTAPGGARDVVVRNEDGRQAVTSFEVLPGETPAVTDVSPAVLIAGESVDVVITGSDFTTDVELTFGPNVVVNDFERVSDTQLTANVTAGLGAALGVVPFSITNQPTGLVFTNGDAGLLAMRGPRTLDLTVLRGDFMDKTQSGKDVFKASGTFAFNGFSDDNAFGVPGEALTLQFGDAENPFVVQIPSGDPGWRVSGNKATWKSVRKATPKVKLVLDLRRGRFAVTVSKTDLVLPSDRRVTVDLEVGDDTGREQRDWILSRVGRLRLR